MALLGFAVNSGPLAFVMTAVSGEHGKPSCFLSLPHHNLQISVRDNLKRLSAFSHKGSSRLTCLYQCPACLGSIVQKSHFHLSLTIQKLICRSNGLHLSICPAAVHCACMLGKAPLKLLNGFLLWVMPLSWTIAIKTWWLLATSFCVLSLNNMIHTYARVRLPYRLFCRMLNIKIFLL